MLPEKTDSFIRVRLQYTQQGVEVVAEYDGKATIIPVWVLVDDYVRDVKQNIRQQLKAND